MAQGIALSAAMLIGLGCGRSGQEEGKPGQPPAGGEASGGSSDGAAPSGAAPSGGSAQSLGGSAFVSAGSGGSAMVGGAGPDLTTHRCLSSFDCPLSGACTTDGYCRCPEAIPTYCSTYSADFEPPACVSLSSNRSRCGDCGTTCPSYAICRDGECGESPTLLSERSGCSSVQGLASVGSDVHWWSERGSETPTLDFAVDGDVVYWLAAGEGNSITRRAVDQLPEVLATGTASQPIVDITAHGGSVYYVRDTEIHALTSSESGWVDSVIGSSPPGGTPQWLIAGDDFVIWYDRESLQQDDLLPGNDAHQYLTSTFAQGVALDGDHLYWWRGELIDRLELGTTQPELVARVPGEEVKGIAFGADYLYIAGGKTVYRQLRTPTADGATAPLELQALAEAPIAALAVTAEHLYWVAGCRLQRLPL